MKTLRVALAFASVAFVVACSSAKGGTTTEVMHAEPMDSGTPETSAKDSSAPVTPPKKDAAPPAPPEAGECSSEGTQTACVTCCSNKHMDGSGVYFVALIDCMCLAENCAKDCEKTLCDPMNPQNADATCQGCVMAKNSKCSTIIKNTCTADADCVAFDACIGKSDCAGK